MPSGGTPNDFFATPAHFGGEDLSIPVEADIVEALRTRLTITREEVFKFVDDEFKEIVETKYAFLGSPTITLQNGWDIYAQLRVALRTVYAPGA